jgi:acetyl/propionyl-CoA carboxylase alpha subunit
LYRQQILKFQSLQPHQSHQYQVIVYCDELSAEDSIITLESDKASMEIPTPVAGKVIDINVTLGDKIKLGDLIAEGILQAIEKVGLSLPIVVRLEGTNAQQGSVTQLYDIFVAI